jgi:hypothetical protein
MPPFIRAVTRAAVPENRVYLGYPPEPSETYKSQAQYPVADSGGMDSPIASVKRSGQGVLAREILTLLG